MMESSSDTSLQIRSSASAPAASVEPGANQQLLIETIDRPSSVLVRARIIRVPETEIYEVTKDELETMIHGSETGLDVNVALATLSIAATSAATIVTSQLSPTMESVWVGVMAGSGLVSVYAFVRWLKGKNAVTRTIDKIKRRGSHSQGSEQ